jgi:choline monooxygenase
MNENPKTAGADDAHASRTSESALALPASCYVGDESHRIDRDAIFARSWHLVAHAAQLDRPGSHLFTTIAGVPLAVFIDASGEPRALHNVCRHRAGPLMLLADSGRVRLRCRYHAWTYGSDGCLLAAPEMRAGPDFDPASIRLPEARIERWRDLVFVSLDAGIAPLADRLTQLDARMAGHDLSRFRFHRNVGYEIACNWKVYVDNYLEGYHIPHIHPELNRMLDYRSYVTKTGDGYSLQHSPLESAAELYGAGDALYVFLWPNAMLNLLPDRLQINRVLPLAHDRCRVEFDYFYPAGDANDRHVRDHAFSDLVQHEDVDICEAVQRGLASGSYSPGPLNPLRESGLRHFQSLVRAAWRNHGTEGADQPQR